MFNLYKLAKRKKGVSPVIAVVLLIALTVAAAAVIWAITQGIIGGGTTNFVIDTTSTDAGTVTGQSATWTGTITVSEGVTITDIRLLDSSGSNVLVANQGWNIDATPTNETSVDITQGESSHTINLWAGTTAVIDSGSYDLEFTYATSGGDPQVVDFSVSF